jgi:hypothetical protein
MIDVSGWRERQTALDQKAENARKLGLGYGCAQCGADGGTALYCVTCAEKYVNKGTRMSEFKPKAWMTCPLCDKPSPFPDPNYREWVGLTEEDLKPICDEWRIVYGAWMDDFARDIEAKLKEKNT